MSRVNTYSKSRDGEINLSENFKIKEFACNDGADEILIDVEMIPILQRFRQYVEHSVIINSAYRTKSYNRYVGGASNSYHIYGRAFDLQFMNTFNYLNSLDKMGAFFNTLGVKGIIKYSWGFHIDTRDNKYHADSNGNSITYSKVNIPIYSNIKYGDKTNDVGVLQFVLKYKYGYNILVDCDFGNNTLNAVKDFQKSHGLDDDGIVGPLTWNKLLY